MEKELKSDITGYSNPLPTLPENKEDEAYDNLTTLDPSHIIKLIRQLITKQSIHQLDAEIPGLRGTGQSGANSDSQTENDVGGMSAVIERETAAAELQGGKPCDPLAAHGESEDRSIGGEDADPPTHVVSTLIMERKLMQKEAMRSADQGEPSGISESMQDSHSQEQQTCDGSRMRGLQEERMEPLGDAREEKEEDPREEAGCVLWDLAATQTHADFLVENRVLEVLAAILEYPYSDRMREICLGILGNLACHPCPLSAMEALQEGALVRSVVHHLFSNHPPTLIEACRTLSAGLHGEGAVRWVGALDTEEVVGRVMWMAANTQQPALLEKSTELLLAMVDGPRDAPSSLLPVLLRLGFMELLTDLLASQVQAVQEGTAAQGDVVLDTVLQITEALSLSEECGAALAGNKNLFLLACHVLRLKEGTGPAGISATVLIANLLAEDTSLVHHLTYDVVVLSQLLVLIPGASDDPGARNALWSILGRMFRQLVTSSGSGLAGSKGEVWGVVSAVAEASSIVVEDLQEHQEEDLEEEQRIRAGHGVATSTSRGLEAKLVTARNMVRLMEQWSEGRGQTKGYVPQGLATVFQACGQLKKSIAVNRRSGGVFKMPQDWSIKVSAL